jgi:hypothetical protein
MDDGKKPNKLFSRMRNQSDAVTASQRTFPSLLPVLAGALMLGVFIINVYIGLFDKNLALYNPVHLYANWVIAIVDLAAAIVLFSKLRLNIRWTILSGILWPLVYILSLVVDIETELGKPNFWPTPAAAYQYLILGDASQGWVLWKYTIPTAIILLVLVAILSAVSILYMKRNQRALSDLNTKKVEGVNLDSRVKPDSDVGGK